MKNANTSEQGIKNERGRRKSATALAALVERPHLRFVHYVRSTCSEMVGGMVSLARETMQAGYPDSRFSCTTRYNYSCEPLHFSLTLLVPTWL